MLAGAALIGDEEMGKAAEETLTTPHLTKASFHNTKLLIASRWEL